MTDFAHGFQKEVTMEILNVGQSINQYGKLSIRVVPKFPYENKVLMLTAEHLDNLAEKAGAQNRFLIAQAVNGCPNDPSFISVMCTYKKEGEAIGTDKDGNPIVSSSGHTTHQKSYWDTEIVGIMLGGEAGIYAQNVVADVLRDMTREAMKNSQQSAIEARRKRLGLNKPDATAQTQSNETPVVEDTTADDDVI